MMNDELLMMNAELTNSAPITQHSVLKVPEIRFKGFSGEWVQNAIGEICGVTFGGGTPSTSESNFWQGNIPWIQSSDLKEGSVSSVNAKKHITKTAVNKSATKLVSGNSIAIVTRVGVGKISLMKAEYTTSQDFLSLSDLTVDTQYAAYAIWKLLQVEKEQVQGTSIKGITKEELLSKTINYPKIKLEQVAIGNHFQKLDSLINQHQQQHAKLSNIKKAMLEKMFPKPGETIPEIRFKGFSGEWEEKKLGDVAEVTMGQSPSGENYTDNPNDFILVQGNADLKNGFVVPRVWTSEVTKTATKGALIFSVRAPVGEVGKTNYDVVLGRGVAAINGNEFIYQQLKKLKSDNYWHKVSAGSTFDAISSTELALTFVWVSSDSEQAAIGNYFQKLDALINQHQQQITKLTHIKQAFLSKMFV